MQELMIDFSHQEGSWVLAFNKKNSDTKNGTLTFRNELNSIIFPKSFTARDYDIFFTICWYAKQKNYAEINDFVEMPFSEIARFYEKGLNKTRFHKEVCVFVDKVLGEKGSATLKSHYIDNGEEVISGSTFFIHIEAFRNKQILKFKMYKYSVELLFSLLNFMHINLYEFVSLKGKFSKTLYRLLKQYENIKSDEKGCKNITFNKNDFQKLMHIPDSYDSNLIASRVLVPCVSELKDIFGNLEVEKIYKNNKLFGYSFKYSARLG